jgi:hypothetical protein
VTANAHGDDQGVAEVANLHDLGTEVGEDGEQGPPPFTDAVVTTVVGTALQLHDARREFHFRVCEREVGVEITPVEGVVGAIEPLDVLLRHRPRSVPRSASTTPFHAKRCFPGESDGGREEPGGSREGRRG